MMLAAPRIGCTATPAALAAAAWSIVLGGPGFTLRGVAGEQQERRAALDGLGEGGDGIRHAGPSVTELTPSLPETRAYPSAMLTAGDSWRAA